MLDLLTCVKNKPPTIRVIACIPYLDSSGSILAFTGKISDWLEYLPANRKLQFLSRGSTRTVKAL